MFSNKLLNKILLFCLVLISMIFFQNNKSYAIVTSIAAEGSITLTSATDYVPICVYATDPSGISLIEIYGEYGGTNGAYNTKSGVVTYPYQANTWYCNFYFSSIKHYSTGATNNGDGYYYFVARVVNGAGASQWTAWTSVFRDTTNPTGSVTSGGTMYTTTGKVTITGTVNDNYAVSKVQFPTWSATGGQDDIVWYEKATSAGNFSYEVNLGNHSPKSAGYAYYIHVYAVDAVGHQVAIGGTTVYWRTALTIPSIKGSYTYNGSSQTVQWNNFNSSYMNVSNNTRTNAGSQTVTVSLKDTTYYQWSDGTTANKTFTWTIAKANMGTPSVSIDTDGKVTWGAVTGATGYEISFDNKTWTSASSGGKYVDKTSTRNENSLCTSSAFKW